MDKKTKVVEYTDEEKAAFLNAETVEVLEETNQPKVLDMPEPPKSKSNAVVVTGQDNRGLIIQDMDGAWRMATVFAASGMLPKAYYSDGNEAAKAKAFTAMQLGAEVGLPPMQSIQSIAIVNGVATIWGDTQKALVERSGLAESIDEYFENGDVWTIKENGDKVPNPNFKAVCKTLRKGRKTPVEGEFSIADAIEAKLWGKAGKFGPTPWVTHPKRMLKYKARAFVLRDAYPDVLKGLTHSCEEMEGEVIENTPHGSAITPDDSASELSKLLETKHKGKNNE